MSLLQLCFQPQQLYLLVELRIARSSSLAVVLGRLRLLQAERLDLGTFCGELGPKSLDFSFLGDVGPGTNSDHRHHRHQDEHHHPNEAEPSSLFLRRSILPLHGRLLRT